MCYPKPGPRCSAHVSKAIIKASNRYLLKKSEENHEKYREKVQEYLETPKGIKLLEESYGKNSNIAMTYRVRRKRMIENFHAENPNFNKQIAETRFNKKHDKRDNKAAQHIRYDLLKDNFIKDSLHSRAAIDGNEKYDEIKSQEMNKHPHVNYDYANGYSTDDFSEKVEYYSNTCLIYTIHEQRNTPTYSWSDKEDVRKTVGTQNERSVIAVKNYVPAKEMSVGEYELQEQMSQNLGTIRSLQKLKTKTLEDEEMADYRKRDIAKKLDNKISEGYSSIELLSKQLREHSEKNISLNRIDSVVGR